MASPAATCELCSSHAHRRLQLRLATATGLVALASNASEAALFWLQSCRLVNTLTWVQVQQQLRNSNLQLARANLAQEEVLAELRNQIAIIRSVSHQGV